MRGRVEFVNIKNRHKSRQNVLCVKFSLGWTPHWGGSVATNKGEH